MFEFNAFFLLNLFVLVLLVVEAVRKLDRTWSRPALIVYFTIGFWYFYEITQNGILYYNLKFGFDLVEGSLLQVLTFLLVFRGYLAFLPEYERNPEANLFFVDEQQRLDFEKKVFTSVFAVWAFLTLIGLWMLDGDFFSIFFPPLSSDPQFIWSRGAVGTKFDFLISICGYCHVAAVGMLGIQFVTFYSSNLRYLSLILFLIAIEAYLFQRARSGILAVILPGVFSYIFISRDAFAKKAVILTTLLIVISGWFAFIQSNREKGSASIVKALNSEPQVQAGPENRTDVNMFEELCYIRSFLTTRVMTEEWGESYLAELAAFVPRGIWKDKPMIGINYAIMRGFGGSGVDHGVFATISRGMIGQGVCNFGDILGPAAAALLMGIWVQILAKLWSQRYLQHRLALFLIGLGLTFNMGRDITSLVLFPFLFAYLGVLFFEFVNPQLNAPRNPHASA
ncbi:hypothetical protein KIH39_07635 [Telmatocola sphagniphila]|uniref:Oligosaccharide repeat unit polymerase n=1 Tax=Telmatocola sphagniphila TaxID=1123043 RepID=A0A8E6EUJ0_9BACT|nr:hypothetical protein [Telmatocola sphagniphila]QVL33769.1 hypothetical protein KIH39_07635 [Telmatocola sphagniphila]